MHYKHQQRISKLYTHLRDYTIYIILIAAGFMVIFGFINVAQNRAQQNSLDKQLATTNKLVEQVKDLTKENKKIAQTAADYAYCNSVILAQYTQTGNPISVEDLEECKFTSYPDMQVSQSPTTGSNSIQGNTNPQTGTGTQRVAVVSPSNTGGSSQGNTVTPPSSNPSPTPTKPAPQPTPPAPTPVPTPPPVITVQPTFLLPGISATVPCIGVAKLLYIGCS